MLTSILVSLALVCSADDPVVGADEFASVLAGAISDLQDLEFIYEGEEFLARTEPNELRQTFQGVYAFRFKDGATYLNVYRMGASSQILSTRSVAALLGKRLERVSQRPDRKGPLWNNPQIFNGGPGTLNEPGAPERFSTFWFLRGILSMDIKSYHYKQLGWVDIDGHNCLHVQVDESPGGTPPAHNVVRFCLDMVRGCIPLRVEYLSGEKVEMAVHSVRLESVTLPGGKILWLPVAGTTDSYLGGDGLSKTPVIREVSYVVGGSLRVNKGLKDDRFSVSWKDSRLENEVMKKARKSFEKAQADTPKPKPPDNDPVTAQERLDTQLAAADAQAKQLEASSAARESWAWPQVTQVAAGALGVVLLAGAGYWKWRSG